MSPGLMILSVMLTPSMGRPVTTAEARQEPLTHRHCARRLNHAVHANYAQAQRLTH